MSALETAIPNGDVALYVGPPDSNNPGALVMVIESLHGDQEYVVAGVPGHFGHPIVPRSHLIHPAPRSNQ